MSDLHVDVELAKLRKAVDAFERAAGYGAGGRGWLHGCGRRLWRLAAEGEQALQPMNEFTVSHGLERPERYDAVWSRWWLAMSVWKLLGNQVGLSALLAHGARIEFAARGDWNRAALAAQIEMAAADVVAGEVGSGLAVRPVERELESGVTGRWLALADDLGVGVRERAEVEACVDRWRGLHFDRRARRSTAAEFAARIAVDAPSDKSAQEPQGVWSIGPFKVGYPEPDGGCDCPESDGWCRAPVLASTPLAFTLGWLDEV